jgi:hypothetical protein
MIKIIYIVINIILSKMYSNLENLLVSVHGENENESSGNVLFHNDFLKNTRMEIKDTRFWY